MADETASGNEVYFQIPRVPMCKLIVEKMMLPTRCARYCCAELKEVNGVGRVVVTGVRWAESLNRRETHGVADIQGKPKTTKELADVIGANYKLNKRGNVIMNDDNDEARRMVEHCFRTQKTMVNPIVDWTEEDVWNYIEGEGLGYCKLYDIGHKRIGCVGCPMSGYASVRKQFEQYPCFKALYRSACQQLIKARQEKKRDDDDRWRDADNMMAWWLGYYEGVERGQISIYEILEGET